MAARLREGESYYYETSGDRIGPVLKVPGGFGLPDIAAALWDENGVGLRRPTPDGKYITQDDLVEVWVGVAQPHGSDPVALTNERKNQHGDWYTQSTLADNLMFQLTHSTNWDKMGGERRQALFNIAQKMSRICTGDPYVEDHWDDIAGYAYLGKGGHGK